MPKLNLRLREEKMFRNVFVKFLNQTQIMWLYYMSTRRGIWRIIWIVIIISGLVIALVQSRKALSGYIGYDVNLQTTYRLNATLPFPAITVCSNSPINWLKEEADNSSTYQEIVARLENKDERLKYNNKFTKRGKPYEEYVLFDVLRKYSLPEPTYGVIKAIEWNGTKYMSNREDKTSFHHLMTRRLLKTFTRLYYGSCLTFNAGFDNEEKIEASALTGIKMTLDWDPKNRYPYINDPAAIFVIHPVGTAPIFNDGNLFKIYLQDEVIVGLKEKFIDRLPKPYPSQCIENSVQQQRSNSVYYSEAWKYLYSVDACINTCVQTLSLDICNCWEYTIPVGWLENSSKFHQASICASKCSKVDSALNLKQCNCYPPCREQSLDTSFFVTSNSVTDLVIEFNKHPNNATDHAAQVERTIAQQTQESEKTVLKLFLKTSMYEYVNEVPKYTVPEFWGIIGGNVAFWIGMSAVSLFEIVELAFHLIFLGCQFLSKRLRKVNNVHYFTRRVKIGEFKRRNAKLPFSA